MVRFKNSLIENNRSLKKSSTYLGGAYPNKKIVLEIPWASSGFPGLFSSLKPTVFHDDRYVTVEVNFASKSKGKLDAWELIREIQRAVQTLHGDFGCGAVRSGLSASYCNELTRIAIVRTRLGAHKLITSSLPFVTKIGKENVNLRMLYVGGTLRHCYKRILIHQKAELSKILSKLPPEKDAKEVEKGFLTLGGFFANCKQPEIGSST